MVHKKILIQGSVQGVGFRYAARKIASQYNIKGFVRNMPDGSVYIEAEGSEHQIAAFISWCYTGPPRAGIKSVAVKEGNVMHFSDFKIAF